jgi:hypothetical protein
VDGFSIEPVEGLRSPVVLIAFMGWSDTGTVTVDVARHLVDTYDATRFMEVDPEDYYVFTDTRPMVSVSEAGIREITWPSNEAFWAKIPGAGHDLVVVSGVEPNLRWRSFSEQLSGAIAKLEPSLVCTLVARPAATPHTRPIPVTGSSADPALASRFGLGRSMYQGPTGIIGVIHDTLRHKNVPLISLAAGVPHYLNVAENPPATMALLRALEPVLGFMPALGNLEREGVDFIEKVEEASQGDGQIGDYVRALEEQYNEASPPEIEPPPSELSADDVLRDVEDLLRGGGD